MIEFKDHGIIFIKNGLGSRLLTEKIYIGGLEWSPNNVRRIDFATRCALASAVQQAFEEAVLHVVIHLKKITNCENLIFSGGCALNSKLNGKILDLGKFKNVYVPPAPNDAGTAVGAALYGWCHLLKNKRPEQTVCPDWGPDLGKIDIKRINDNGYSVETFSNSLDLAKKTAELLRDKEIVFLAHGNMEFGPRALGHRSILAHPGNALLRDRLNKMKRRAYFRPLAPSIIEDKFRYWFTGDADYYMNKVACLKKSKKGAAEGAVHSDNSARVQLVPKDGGLYYEILNEFYKITNIPILINTSLNLKGKPIARSFEDVFKVFDKLEPDALVLDNILITKKSRLIIREKRDYIK
ncbi:MAG: carbamoyltransferase C-terminal domain-containing protein [Candidatus Berkelbacteria bacterium]